MSREILSLQRKFGSNSSECLLEKYERELIEETKSKIENDLKSPNAYTGLINQISLMVVGEDSHKYCLTFDKDLNLIGFVKN